MINKGVVKTIDGDKISVHLYKESACAHCNGCGKESKMSSVFDFTCKQSVEIGDTITFEIEDKSLLNIAAIVYLLPIAFMIGGYFLGQALSLVEGARVAMSFGALVISFIFIYFFDKIKGAKMIENKVRIIEIEKIEDIDNIIIKDNNIVE